jgi:FkbM family methyltransferase
MVVLRARLKRIGPLVRAVRAGRRARTLARRAAWTVRKPLIVADRSSLRRARALEQGRAGAGRPLVVRVRPLLGAPVALRPQTSDVTVLWDTFLGGYHLPPRELELDSEASTIWDLGANIGLTMADLAVRFPNARVLGVELDEANAAVCRRNVSPWADRCRVLEAAVWTAEGEVAYRRRPGHELGTRIEGPGAGTQRVRAITLDRLMAEHDGWVDYIKMDIEGAEREVLRRDVGWAQRVRAIRVEVHEPYTPAQCAGDLRALGFAPRVERRYYVVGVRAGSAAGTAPATASAMA